MRCCVETERHREESRDRDGAEERGEEGIPPCSQHSAAHQAPGTPSHTCWTSDQSVRGQSQRRTSDQSYLI